jgi:hypothetical protein
MSHLENSFEWEQSGLQATLGGGFMANIQKVTDRVNSARSACSLAPLSDLPQGERGNPCFCPLGRALRKDMGESFFLAVGTKHIRLASAEGNANEIARRIREAWGINEKKIVTAGTEQFAIVPLPPELTQFVLEFDAGKLPNFEGNIEDAEKVSFTNLAKGLWNVTVDRVRRVRRLSRGQPKDSSTPAKFAGADPET